MSKYIDPADDDSVFGIFELDADYMHNIFRNEVYTYVRDFGYYFSRYRPFVGGYFWRWVTDHSIECILISNKVARDWVLNGRKTALKSTRVSRDECAGTPCWMRETQASYRTALIEKQTTNGNQQ